jgi:hypothetical protein
MRLAQAPEFEADSYAQAIAETPIQKVRTPSRLRKQILDRFLVEQGCGARKR